MGMCPHCLAGLPSSPLTGRAASSRGRCPRSGRRMDGGKHQGLGGAQPTSHPLLPLASHRAVGPRPAPQLWPCRPWAERPPAPAHGGCGAVRLALDQPLLQRGSPGPFTRFTHHRGCWKVLGGGRPERERAVREASKQGQRECAPGLQPRKWESLCGQLAFRTHNPWAQERGSRHACLMKPRSAAAGDREEASRPSAWAWQQLGPAAANDLPVRIAARPTFV